MRTERFKGVYCKARFKKTFVKASIVLLLIGIIIVVLTSMNIATVGSTSEESSGQLGQEARLDKLSGPLRTQLEGKAPDEMVRVIVKLVPADLDGVRREQAVGVLKAHAKKTQERVLKILHEHDARTLNAVWLGNAILAEARASTIRELTLNPTVWKIYEDFKVTVLESEEWPMNLLNEQLRMLEAHSSDDNDNVTWGLAEIQAPDVWDLGINGSGIRVAVLDTGVDINNPDLAGKMWTVDPEDPTYPGGWIEFRETGDIVPNSTPWDSQTHGTHCSGTVLGDNASGTAIGVAPGAWLMHALVLPYGGGSAFSLLKGMEWAIEPYDQYGNLTGWPADVVSMSWREIHENYYENYIWPIEEMRAAGIVPVVAIGNDGEGTSSTPGNVYGSFGIGAIDNRGSVAYWSSGQVVNWPASHPDSYIKPDFSAPGVSVYSSLPLPDNWGIKSGTSMAAPHVAGVVALMMNADNSLSVDDVYDILVTTSEDQGDPGKDTRYGWGIVNAYDAVGMVLYNSGIQGYVVDAETWGEIPWEAKVTIKERGSWKYTFENGYYKIFAPPGNYTLVVDAFGYYDNTTIVNVIENQWVTENIALAPMPTGFITGHVRDNDNNPIENATVALLETPLKANTGMEGDYTLETPVGLYDIKASAIGYHSAYKYDVEVGEDQVITENFQLMPIKPAPLADTPWPKFMHDLLNTGQSPYLGSQENELRWRANDIDDHIISSPSIGPDGTIYVGAWRTGNLWALNPNGTLKWHYPTFQNIWCSPAVNSDGIIFFGTSTHYRGKLFALTSEGELLWTFTDRDNWPIVSSPAIGQDGTIYFGTYSGFGIYPISGRFYALKSDGTPKWPPYQSNTGWIYSSPAIGLDGTIYFTTLGYWGETFVRGGLYALDENGVEKWNFLVLQDYGGVYGSPAIGPDGTIYFASEYGIYALCDNGTLKWCHPCGVDTPSLAIGSDGTIYSLADGQLYALNSDNTLKWSYDPPIGWGRNNLSLALGSDNTVYITTTEYPSSINGCVYAISSAGEYKWSYFSDPSPNGLAINSDGTIYFTSETLYAIGPAYGVSVSISPEYRVAETEETLTYDIIVTNTGQVQDNYNLTVTDNAGWNPIVSPTSLTVPPKENRTATLTVTVPGGTLPNIEDNITVAAISRAVPTVMDSDTCFTVFLPKVEFSLVTLYKVSLNVDNLWLGNGSKLVLKFYTWGDAFQAENVVWSGTTPEHIVLLEDIPHPQGRAVEKARLVLTYDNTEDVISTLSTFIVRKAHLDRRFSKIPGEWFLAPPGSPERTELEIEFGRIPSAWFLAPS